MLCNVVSAAEDAISAASTAQHLQRVHGVDRAAAVCRSLLIARLSQVSVSATLSAQVTHSLTHSLNCNVS